MIVKVTKRHILNGERNNCYSCPISLAIGDACDCDKVIVDENSASFIEETDGKRIYHKLPRSAIRFIKRYDEEESVKPFKFILSERTRCL